MRLMTLWCTLVSLLEEYVGRPLVMLMFVQSLEASELLV